MAEPNAMGNISGIGPSSGVPRPEIDGPTSRSSINAMTDLHIPKIDNLNTSLKTLKNSMAEMKKVMMEYISSGIGPKVAAVYKSIAEAGKAAAGSFKDMAKGLTSQSTIGPHGQKPNVWDMQAKKNPADIGRIVPMSSGGGGGAPPGGGGGGGFGGGGGTPPAGSSGSSFPRPSGASRTDDAVGHTLGAGIADALNNFFKNLTGQNGIMGVLGSAITGVSQLYGAVAGSGIQYAYNRINGPTGNQNMMLRLAQALAPNTTFMSAAGGTDITMRKMIMGLAQKMPIMGTQDDMLAAILGGQQVGAFMRGTEGRNGYFESLRQMQVLNPGMAPANIAGTLSGYMRDTRSQQRGVFIGQGAFTMFGQGGRYKTLAEWAAGITKFFEQQRPGGAQGSAFTREELVSQNFPGSNINAWFQMMGVPENMVDFWWQYVLTKTDGTAPSQMTSDLLNDSVQKQRGINLGYERLRNVTQGTRRDYLMGNNMYLLYGGREAADRRFNVAFQGVDNALSRTFLKTNIGRALSLLPTPIMEMLMPILTQFATSPLGAVASAVGGVFGDPPSIGDPDRMPYGDISGYGDTGGTTTAHLSPDLAKRVNRMLKANPRLKISSSYRDTVTQNRLRRNGATAVGHPSRSAHTRGWAVDIGPVSQMGWLASNAKRFGLQTAANQGEPWHIQQAGTMPVGDPGGDDMPYGGLWDTVTDAVDSAVDFGKDAFGAAVGFVKSPLKILGGVLSGTIKEIAKGVANGFIEMFKDVLGFMTQGVMGKAKDVISNFINGGSFSDMIDGATKLYAKLITAPLTGMIELFGNSASGGNQQLRNLISESTTVPVPIVGLSGSKNTIPTEPLFGDPPVRRSALIGDPYDMMMKTASSPSGTSTPKIVFQIDNITISGGSTSAIDSRRAARALMDDLEAEANSRLWRVQ